MGLGWLPRVRAQAEGIVICLRYVDGELHEEKGDPWGSRAPLLVSDPPNFNPGDVDEAYRPCRELLRPHEVRAGVLLYLAGGVEPDHEHLADVERWIRGRRR